MFFFCFSKYRAEQETSLIQNFLVMCVMVPRGGKQKCPV